MAPEGGATSTDQLELLLAEATLEVERFFGAPFPRSVKLTAFPDRASFDASFPPEWGLARTECWMVAAGVAEEVRLLDPSAWTREACEHDPLDVQHLRRLLTHELVHAFHGQHNPSPDFVDTNGIDWFAEGLATYAAGQLADPALASAREALERGAGPSSLAKAWIGRYRYGVCGSLVAFLDHEFGRARLCELLGATSGEELLDRIGRHEFPDESSLLADWSAWALAEGE